MSDYKLTIKHIGMLGNEGAQTEILPVVDADDGQNVSQSDIPSSVPVLSLRNTILFPGVVLPVAIGRKQSLALIKEMDASHGMFAASMQIDASVENPQISDLYQQGTLARVIKVLEMPDGSTSVILQGRARVSLGEQTADEPYLQAAVSLLEDEPVSDEHAEEFEAVCSSLKDFAVRLIKETGGVPPEASFAVRNIDGGAFLINFIASNTDIPVDDKQSVLSINNIYDRGIELLKILSREAQFLDLKKDIQSKVKQGLDQQQREYMLQQQIRTIQDELGDNPVDQEVETLKERAKEKEWSAEMAAHFEKEIDKLMRLNPNSAEYSVQYNYIDALLGLPWNKVTNDDFDIKKAKSILDQDHFGLDKVKERILEHLAVLKLKHDMKSPIICLYGPPGVGKTSLGKSIANALGRSYVRMSLGGVYDESEIRGHRKTYIGAMPGRVIQNISKAGTSNPVFVLDEIDKISHDYHGDPSSALLEVLDPEQNATFHDNYLEVEYDLSKVMFIATANNVSNIQGPLLDRMELIDVSGYITEEKVEIATRHLLPKQQAAHGIDGSFKISKQVLSYIVEKYTRESGVRELDKALASICRKIAMKTAIGEKVKKSLTQADVCELLGVEKYTHDIWQDDNMPGVVTGLAWTAVGGEILFVETSVSKGKGGKLTLTGNLGDVMKESAVIALEYVRAHADRWGLKSEDFEENNFHIHVPEGAIPKDGPSAGVTMTTSIVSALTHRNVRKRLAMTGEITLRGKVLPVGGIKEKILAAKRAGITDIIISEENRKDIAEIKDIYIKGLEFHYVKTIPDVLDLALEK